MAVRVGSAYFDIAANLRPLDESIAQAQQRVRAFQQQLAGMKPVTLPGLSGGQRALPGGNDLAADFVRQQQAAARLEVQQSRLARARQDDAGATALLSQAQERLMALLQRENLTFEQTIATQRQLAQVQTQVAQGNRPVASFADELGNGLKGSLLGVIGPAALAAGALGTVAKIVSAGQAGFALKNQLDQTTASLEIQLEGVRDSANVFAEAEAIGRRYNLTQQQTSEALQTSVSILRVSKAGTDELLSTVLRLQATAPEKPISDAARAIRELASGDVTSIKELFNVSARDAHRMKEAIQQGQDPVRVVAEYLSKAGADTRLLELRTRGAVGAQNELAQAQERFNLALGGLASTGPAVSGMRFLSDVTNAYAVLLNGDGIAGVQRFTIEQRAAAAQAEVYANAIKAGKSETEAAEIAQAAYEEAVRRAAAAMGLSIPVGEGFRSTLRGIAADASNAAAELEGVRDASSFKGSIGSKKSPESKGTSLKNAQDAAAAAAAYRNQVLATGTAAQVLAVRQQEYNEAVARFGKNSAQAIDAQTKLIQAQKAARAAASAGSGKGLSTLDRTDLQLIENYQQRFDEINRRLAGGKLTELQRKQLTKEKLELEEKIGDAQLKQLQTINDINLARANDALARIKEEQQLVGLQAILTGAGFSEQQRQIAALQIAKIRGEQTKRALDIQKDQNEAAKLAGQTGAPGALPAGQAGPIPTAALPSIPAPTGSSAQAAAALAALPPVTINLTVNVDRAGNATVQNPNPGINLNMLRGAGLASQAAGG